MSIFRELGVREGADRLNEEVVYTLARSYLFLEQAISSFLAFYGLTPAKFNILLMVKHKGKQAGLPQNVISQSLLVTTSNITRMVDKLEKDQHVQRLAKKGDRRINLIKITDKGSALLDKVWPHYKNMLDNLIALQFSDKDKVQLVSLLNKLKLEESGGRS